jgi:hypothetical protein
MPRINFNEIEDVDEFSPLPEGNYLCELVGVEESRTNDDEHEMWKLKFKVVEKGSYANRIIFDNMTFYEDPKQNKRVKFICSRLGMNMVGDDIDLQPSDILNRLTIIMPTIEEYNGKDRNKIPWGGYKLYEEQEAITITGENNDASEDDIPF